MEKGKFSVKLNNEDKIEQLLQETYNLACQQYTQIQNEINKIANSTTVNNLDIDGKEKYAKIMNNYILSQQKSIAQKFDIAKLMSEVVKHNGDIKGALNDTKKYAYSFDINAIRKQVAEGEGNNEDNTKNYTLKN